LSSEVTLIVVVVIVVVLLLLARRSRAKIVSREQEVRRHVEFGSEVMTTSGLYGTVVGINDDDSVQLAIAPGVQVRWTIAALRPIETLPARYRGETPGESGPHDPDEPPGGPTS
jgi:preprotein translocase subunit YajC